MNDIVKRIDELRRRKGITQKDLAKAIGISKSAVYKWGKSSSLPSVENIKNVCTVFGITVEQFFSGMNSKSKGGLQETFLDYWRLMGDKEKSAVEHVMETFKELRQVRK